MSEHEIKAALETVAIGFVILGVVLGFVAGVMFEFGMF
jgi:hypothetical protein